MKKLVIGVALGVVLLAAIGFFLFARFSSPPTMLYSVIEPQIDRGGDTKSPPTARPHPGIKAKIRARR